jgi:chromosome segregation ATPase
MEKEDKLDKIIDMIKILETKIDTIDQKIEILTEKYNNIEKDCSKMGEHIEFVEDTYSTVRAPLNYIKNKIEYMMGRDREKELPAIKDKKENKFEDGEYDEMNDLDE